MMAGDKAVEAAIDERIRRYFGQRLDEYGPEPRGVDWSSAEAQEARFAALLETLGPLSSGASLLDAGCGLGDLYPYLNARRNGIVYTGCDLSAPHIFAARKAYPDARFLAGDVVDIVEREEFDVVVACGLLHLSVPRWNRWAWARVRAMYRGSRVALTFTLPVRGHAQAPVLEKADPAEWAARLRALSPRPSVSAIELAAWGDAVYVVRRPHPVTPPK